MTADHPTTEMLDQFLAGTLPDAEMQGAVAHLAGRCESCLRYLSGARERFGARLGAAGTLGTSGRTAPAEAAESAESAESGADGTGLAAAGAARVGAYDGAFIRSRERSAAGAAGIRADQLAAAALWAALEATPAARRLKLVTGDPRFHTWAVGARLLEAAGEFHWRDTGQGPEACRLALAIAERLPAATYPASLRGDLRARALAGLADSLRLDSRLAAARATLERAWEALDDGSGDPLERAALLRVEANVHLALGDGAGAAALLRPAAGMYGLYGERHQEGRTLQKLALAVGHEDPPQGVEIAERALALIDPGREPRLELAARHLLIWFLNDCGLGWQALDLLERSRPLYRECGESEALMLLPWVEARICRRLGELAAAEQGLAEAWHRCRAAGCRQELTLVSLDLAEAFTAQGKNRHALRLLGSCEASLRRSGMHGEGLAAWRLVLAAAGTEAGAGTGAGTGTGAGADRFAAVRARRAEVVLREAALYFRRAWRRALPFPGRPG